MNIEEILEKHKKWLIGDEGGERADLKGANLKGANLKGANLKGADLDFSCLPLWCGSLKSNFDNRQLIQIAYHLVKAGLQSKNTVPSVDRLLIGVMMNEKKRPA